MKKLIIMFLITALLFIPGCGQSGNASENLGQEDSVENNVPGEEKAKVALLLPGTVTDAGWSAAAYEGLLEAEKMYDIEIAFTESVPLAEQEANIRDYANRGYGLIICHGNDFADAVSRVALEFPDTFFAISNSNMRTDNVVGMDVKNEEQGYMMGYAAALASESDKVGFIGAMEIVPMRRAEVGFAQGVKAANPNAECSIAYTGNFDDVGIGKETALAMFDKGVDSVVMYASAAGLGVIQAAEEKNKYVAVTSSSQVELAPEMTLIAVQPLMKANILAAVDAYIENTFNRNLEICGSFKSGLYEVTYLSEHQFDAGQLEKIEEEILALTNGDIEVNGDFE